MAISPEKSPGEGGDLELARQAATGDPVAQRELYERCLDLAFSAAYRLVGGSATAWDVAHDAWVAAISRLHQYRGEAPIEQWVRRIAITEALQHLRRRRLWDRIRDRIEASPRVAQPVSADALDLDRAIVALPDNWRVPFVLHAVEGFTHEEIGTLLGITASASRIRVHRARGFLRSRLAGGSA